MFGVIGVDHLHRIDNFVERAEGEQTAVVTVVFGEASLLNDDRTAGREVATAPIAEPSGVEPHVLIFRHRKFAFRSTDVIAVKPVIDAQLKRRGEAPAVAFKFFSCWSIFDVGRKLKSFSCFFWRGDKAQELAGFTPEI